MPYIPMLIIQPPTLLPPTFDECRYMCRAAGHSGLASLGYNALFFLVQPPLIFLQDTLFPPGRARGPLARILQTLTTLSALLFVSDRLFWQPFEACSLDTRGLEEMRAVLVSVVGFLPTAAKDVLAQVLRL
jgi:hypothetical protein